MSKIPAKSPSQREHTPEQQAAALRVLQRDLDQLELRVEELEERIAPRLASNHNESPLSLT